MFTRIDELLWTDDKYKKLSDDGKFLFIYLFSCPHRNILGFYFLPIPYGSFDLGWDSERFSKGLKELLEYGFINYNFDTNIVFVKNFLRYNPLENPNQVKGAIKALRILPTNAVDKGLVESLEMINKPFIEPLLEQLNKRLAKQEEVEVKEQEEVEEEINVPADAEDVSPPKEEFRFLEDSTEYKAAIYLRKQILEFNPKCKVPGDAVKDLQVWADTLRLMFERDKRTKDELREVINYIFLAEGEFWRPNVQSPGSLRRNWDTIYGQMLQANAPKKNKRGKATTLAGNMQGRDDWDFEALAKLEAERRERNLDDMDGLSSDEIKQRLSVIEGGAS